MGVMLAEGDTLTSTEVAAVASVSTRYVSHLIEESILPAELYARDGKRWFRPSAAAFVAFDSQVADVLTPGARRTAIQELLSRYHAALADSDAWLRWTDPSDLGVTIGPIKVDMVDVFRRVAESLNALAESRALVVRDPEILSGTPIIRGTRIPVYDVAASAEKGLPMERILRAYSDLTARDVELARLWAKANPPMGRPKKAIGPADPGTVTAKRVTRLRGAA
ncbi:DUF433 domain-containing protein [Roseomonas genomospecies 6]|nr:DUF433 domain-containing protein [Roseomonas genomospecies 6]